MTAGYSIFIVAGNLQECEADVCLRDNPAVQPIKPRLISDKGPGKGAGGSSSGATEGEDGEDVRLALAESKRLNEQDDTSLQRALQLSMEGTMSQILNLATTLTCPQWLYAR